MNIFTLLDYLLPCSHELHEILLVHQTLDFYWLFLRLRVERSRAYTAIWSDLGGQYCFSLEKGHYHLFEGTKYPIVIVRLSKKKQIKSNRDILTVKQQTL
jgi:hypothetical protein